MGARAENIEDTLVLFPEGLGVLTEADLRPLDEAERLDNARQLYGSALASLDSGNLPQAAAESNEALALLSGLELVNGNAQLLQDIRSLVGRISSGYQRTIDGWPVSEVSEAAYHAYEQRRAKSGQGFGSLHLLQNLRTVIVKQ